MERNVKVLIVIPAYNEEESILKTVKTIDEYNKKNKTKYDYVVVNDGSKDDTLKIIKDNNINHINSFLNLGIGGAVQTGYKYAKMKDYDIAVQFDGDGQHDVSYIKDLINPIIKKKADMVIGSRFIDSKTLGFKSSALRRVGINLISLVIKLKTRKKIYDTTSGFRAINKKIIKNFVEYYPSEYPEPISTVRVLLDGNIVEEVPCKMKARTGGKSSISSFKNVYYMVNVILSILVMKGKK